MDVVLNSELINGDEVSNMSRQYVLVLLITQLSVPLVERNVEWKRAARELPCAQVLRREWVRRVRAHKEALQNAHSEQEELLPRERLAETHAAPATEWRQVLEARVGT